MIVPALCRNTGEVKHVQRPKYQTFADFADFDILTWDFLTLFENAIIKAPDEGQCLHVYCKTSSLSLPVRYAVRILLATY